MTGRDGMERRARIAAGDLVVAGALLTRLPLPVLADAAYARQARAVWAYGPVGALLALPAALIAAAALGAGLAPGAAAGLALGALVCASGAMHEDGLADCADGFWGGATRERRLEIMRDSRVGVFGVLALILVTGLRWSALAALFAAGAGVGAAAMVAAAAVSRAAMPALMAWLPAARADGLAVRVGAPDAAGAALAGALGAAVALVCLGATGLVAAVVAAGVAALWSLVARAKIGGRTGDVLGAAQQLSETAMLLALLALA